MRVWRGWHVLSESVEGVARFSERVEGGGMFSVRG